MISILLEGFGIDSPWLRTDLKNIFYQVIPWQSWHFLSEILADPRVTGIPCIAWWGIL